MAIVTSQNTKNAIEYLHKNRNIASTWGTSSASDDLDAGPLVNGLKRAFEQRFSRVVRIDNPAQAKSAGANVIAVVDLYVKLGKMSFQTTQVDLKVIFTRLDTSPIETISSVGKAMVPYPAWTLRFKQAANSALTGFVDSFSNAPKLSAFLTTFAKAKRRAPRRGVAEAAVPPIRIASPRPPKKKGWRSAGSGFLLRGTPHILTGFHVIQGVTSIRVSFPSGEVYPGKVVASDANNDVALVLLQGMGPKSKGFIPRLGVRIKPGERVHALGYPLGSRLSRQPSIVSGEVSAATGLEDNIAQFRMTTPINEGNSGGPIVNSKGHLVGVAASGLVQKGIENIRFGTKISAAVLVLEQARLARRFSIEAVPQESQDLTPVEIFREYSPYVVLIETK